MDSAKYIGYVERDIADTMWHKESISIAVRNTPGKVVMECVVETKANMILIYFMPTLWKLGGSAPAPDEYRRRSSISFTRGRRQPCGRCTRSRQ